VHIHRASVHQAAKLVAALLRVAGVTAGLAESNGSRPPGLLLTSPAADCQEPGSARFGTLRSAIEYGLRLPIFLRLQNADRSGIRQREAGRVVGGPDQRRLRVETGGRQSDRGRRRLGDTYHRRCRRASVLRPYVSAHQG